MDFYLPTKQECDAICDKTEAFYRADRVVEGQNVAIYDYRLASISDFVDNKAFELRGLCFVENSKGEWERNILMNKFFNINQTTMEDIVRLTRGTKELYVGPKNTEQYDKIMSKLIKTKEELVEKRGWMYEDVKHKKITRVQNKEDGSIISFVKFENGEIRAKSKTSFESDQAQMAQELYNNNKKYREYIDMCLDCNSVPIFELCSPENQIVLEYQETKLVLLQVREKNSGEYSNIEAFKEAYYGPIHYGIEVAEDFPESMKNLDDLLARKEIDTSDIEGWIITFEDGQMAKIKTDKYLSLHGLIGPDAFRENLLIKTILDGNIDDVIAALVPGEKKNKIIYLSEKVEHRFNHLVVEFKELRRKYFQDFGEVRKDFAIEHSKDELFGSVMKTLKTSFRDVEQTAEKAVKEHIERSTNSLGKAKEWIGKI